MSSSSNSSTSTRRGQNIRDQNGEKDCTDEDIISQRTRNHSDLLQLERKGNKKEGRREEVSSGFSLPEESFETRNSPSSCL